jgi:iron complex outermembrane receptor protein
MIGFSITATAAFAADLPADLTALSLEDLMNIKVTSVSKRAEKLSDAPAAIYVLTGEDIRRSSASTIPDALRLVPGLQVAQIDANKWAVSARGFNANFANKLLVLIDGRSVYTPLYSGVFWDVQDVLLEDIDRIEVIRGPGATLWGANAVNGVINIITKSTQNTQGTIVHAGAGTEERGFIGMRHGGSIGDKGSFRVYGKYFDRDHSVFPDGSPAIDGWDEGRGGFRFDYKSSADQILTAQGDIYDGRAGVTYLVPGVEAPYMNVVEDQSKLFGGNVLARWTQQFSESSGWTVQAYYDHASRQDILVDGYQHIFDIDAQHRFSATSRQKVIYGFGYRRTSDGYRSESFETLAWFNPGRRADNLFSSFVQSEIELSRSKMWLTIGSKFEHNDYTAFEFQPSVRARWSLSDRNSAWAAISRAVRTPSRMEHDGTIEWFSYPPLSASNPLALPIFLILHGNEDYVSEKLMAYEAGFRSHVRGNLMFDLAAYVNVYEDLRITERGIPAMAGDPPTHFVIPLWFSNDLKGVTSGAEIAADWQTYEWLRLRGGYSYLNIDLESAETATDTVHTRASGFNPRHQAFVRGVATVPRGPELDLALRAVDELSAAGIDSYIELDARLGVGVFQDLSVSLVGRNLLGQGHTEFRSELTSLNTQVERAVYGTIHWKY